VLKKICILTLLCFSAFADQPATAPKSVFADKFVSLQETSDPDFSCFNISYEGGWPNAKFGANLPISDYSQPSLRCFLYITPFLELFSRGISVIPYQLWRGSLGVKLYLEIPDLLPKDQRLAFRFGVCHESDHYTGSYDILGPSYYWEYGDIYFSFYDYIDGKLSYQYEFANEKLKLLLSCGGKFSFDRFLPEVSNRNTQYTYNLEAILSKELSQDTDCFLSVYYELMHSEADFSNITNPLFGSYPVVMNYNGAPQEYFYARLGLNLKGEGRSTYQPYLQYVNANGRGVDYLLKRATFGFGLRIIL